MKPEALKQRRIKAVNWNQGGLLAKITAKRTELEGNRLEGSQVPTYDKKGADAALRGLVEKKAVLIAVIPLISSPTTAPPHPLTDAPAALEASPFPPSAPAEAFWLDLTSPPPQAGNSTSRSGASPPASRAHRLT